VFAVSFVSPSFRFDWKILAAPRGRKSSETIGVDHHHAVLDGQNRRRRDR
jgi:hypothetical protein